MNSEGNTRIKIILGTILLVISMLFQTVAWFVDEERRVVHSEVVHVLRAISLFVFILSVIIFLLIYSVMRKEGKKNKKDVITFSRIATSIAADYESIFYLNTENDSYNEYARTDSAGNNLEVVSSGDDFFVDSKKNIENRIVEADKEKVFSVINKEYLYSAFKEGRVIDLDYRIIRDNAVYFYHLKVTKGSGKDDKYIVIGIRNNDKQMREQQKNKEAAEQGITYGKIAQALASRYEVLYYVDTDTNEYVEYSSSKAYSKLDIGSKGRDFFKDCQLNMVRDIYTDDYPILAAAMDKKNLLAAIDAKGTFTITYRLVLDGNPEYVNLRALRPRDDKHHMVVGVININDSMQREEEYKERLDTVMNMANRDALTGVKNKNAYTIMENEINEGISSGKQPEFSVVFCDVNNLKWVNDSLGHKAGDDYIRDACMMICRVFKHSPVYRVGGDEFSVILKGEDYENRKALVDQIRTQAEINSEDDKVVISIGMADFDPEKDKSLSSVFERADREMYKNKKELKS